MRAATGAVNRNWLALQYFAKKGHIIIHKRSQWYSDIIVDSRQAADKWHQQTKKL